MKFKIYDKVWVILSNKVEQYVVFERKEKANCIVKTDIYYRIGTTFDKNENWTEHNETCLFATKQELLDSL